MKNPIKILSEFWLEVLLGTLILFCANNIRWFLLYFFILFLILIERQYDYLRKLTRFYQLSNEIKLLTIIRKLKITDDEMSIVANNEIKNVDKKVWEEFQKEYDDLINNK